MRNNLKKILGKIFIEEVVDSLIRLLPVLFLVGGAALAFVGWYFSLTFFTSLGSTIVAAGVFSSLIKAYQFKGIFAEDLQKIIYTEEYFGAPKDPNRAWRALARAIFSRRFPDWPDEATDLVVKRYMPSEVKHYYCNMKRAATLSIDDKMPDILCLQDVVCFDYYPAKDNLQPVYEFYFSTQDYALPDKKFQEDVVVSIDDVDMSEQLEFSEPEHSELAGKNFVTFRCSLALPELRSGANHFKIKRSSTRHHNFIVDPYSRVFSDTFIKGYSLTLFGLDKLAREQRFSLSFIDAGVKEKFKNDLGDGSVPKDAFGGHFWHTPELIFPASGYILTFRRLEDSK